MLSFRNIYFKNPLFCLKSVLEKYFLKKSTSGVRIALLFLSLPPRCYHFIYLVLCILKVTSINRLKTIKAASSPGHDKHSGLCAWQLMEPSMVTLILNRMTLARHTPLSGNGMRCGMNNGISEIHKR